MSFISPVRATYPAHLIPLDLITVMIFDEDHLRTLIQNVFWYHNPFHLVTHLVFCRGLRLHFYVHL
jgi:hypothetical protein